jgi:cation diffusion facilitator family transporter
MGGTFAVNLGVVYYERRAARRLQSEVLLADSHHTTSDLMTSATVIVALIGVKLGYLWLDPVAALVVAVFIGYACWEIFESTTGILADRFVIAEEEIREVVKSVPEVIGTHHIRTRGSAIRLPDLHIWMTADMKLGGASPLACREGSTDAAVSADQGCDYSHRAAAAKLRLKVKVKSRDRILL